MIRASCNGVSIALIGALLVWVGAGTSSAIQEGSRKTGQQKAVSKTASGTAQVLAQIDDKLLACATKDARSQLEKILDRTQASHLVALGRILEQERKYGPAIAELKKASQLDPADPAPWVYMAETHLRTKRASEAAGAAARAAELARAQVAKSPKRSQGYYYLGVAEQRRKNFEAAVKNLSQAQKLDGGHKLTLYQLGTTRAFQERWAEAVDFLTQALAKDTGIAYAYYYRGVAYGRQNRKDLMIRDLNRFLELAPNAPEAVAAKRLVAAGRR